MRRQTAGLALATAPGRREWPGAASIPLGFIADDGRADGGVRSVAIEGDLIRLDRVIAGVRMRLRLYASDYQGVALSVTDSRTGTRVAVSLVHPDRDLDVPLFEAGDDLDATAEWRYWAGRFDLPMLIELPDGRFDQPFGRLGALAVETAAPRRRGSALSDRRPRFLTRRRVGR